MNNLCARTRLYEQRDECYKGKWRVSLTSFRRWSTRDQTCVQERDRSMKKRAKRKERITANWTVIESSTIRAWLISHAVQTKLSWRYSARSLRMLLYYWHSSFCFNCCSVLLRIEREWRIRVTKNIRRRSPRNRKELG